MQFDFKYQTLLSILRRIGGNGQFLLSAVFTLITAVLLSFEPDKIQAQPEDGPEIGIAYLPMVSKTGCSWYVETGDMVILEVEQAPAVDEWSVDTHLPGFTGDSFYTWRGPNYFGTPGNAVLSYPILISSSGQFNLRIHNRHDFPDPTEENDVWVRMDNGSWIKAYSPVNGQWTWQTWFDFGTHQSNAIFNLSPGPHTFEISARSKDFSIDRIALYMGNVNGQDTSLPVSPCV